MSKTRALPYLFILTAGVLWGGTFSLAIIATGDGVHPLMLTAWQVLLTAVIASVLGIIMGTPFFRLKNLNAYLVIGILGIITPDILYYSAAPHLSAGILSITISTVPLFTYAIMWALRFEPFAMKRMSGIVVGMLAILMLIIPDQGLSSADATFWIWWVVVCAWCYSAENVYVAEGIGDKLHVFEIISGSTIVASVFLIPATLILGVTEPLSWIVTKSGWAITATAFISVIAYAMFFYTIKIAGPVFASQCAYVVTFAGVLWGIALFAEKHTVWVWLSVAVVMAGIALVTPTRSTNDESG